MSDRETKTEFRAHVFRAWTTRFSRCLAPGNSCDEQAIAAHSIQRSGRLSLLASAGHVFVLASPIDPDNPPDASFTLVGTRKASVFTGLCSAHDNGLFAPIERKPFDPTDREQLGLLAYRAVLQETHASMEAATRLQSAYLKELDLGWSDPNDPSPRGIFTTQRLVACYATWLYKEQCDAAVVRPPTLEFEHDVMHFPGTGPRIAVSAMFSLDNLRVCDDIARAAITVLPTEKGDTYAVLSYLPKDATIVRAELTPILASRGAAQRYLLSRLILERCWNIAFAPALVNAMSSRQKSTILTFFSRTVLRNDSDFQSPLLNLFDEAA